MRLNRGRKKQNQYGYRGLKKPGHTHVRQKKRVEVILYDGTSFKDVYLRQDGRMHIFKERGKIKSSLIYQLRLAPKSKEMQKIINNIEAKKGY